MNLKRPSISLEPVKLETSSLVCGLTDWPTNQKNAKVGQNGRGLRHVTYFLILGPLHISGKVAARDFKFGVLIHRQA